MWYAREGVLILNEIVSPGVTLIAVAKPCIDGSPEPVTVQSLRGSPGCAFSQAITPPAVGVTGFDDPDDAVGKRNWAEEDL